MALILSGLNPIWVLLIGVVVFAPTAVRSQQQPTQATSDNPVAGHEARRIYGERGDLHLADTPESAAEGADALALVTEWRVFQSPDFDEIKGLLRQPVVFDGRNIYDPQLLASRGFTYYGIGRGAG